MRYHWNFEVDFRAHCPWWRLPQLEPTSFDVIRGFAFISEKAYVGDGVASPLPAVMAHLPPLETGVSQPKKGPEECYGNKRAPRRASDKQTSWVGTWVDDE